MRQTVNPTWALERYEEIRDRLPDAAFPTTPRSAPNLGAVSDNYDAFIFDSFGVLNVGDAAIETAVRRVQALRAAGKRVFVLTNAASVPIARTQDKYEALGFDFAADEIVSSRAVVADALTGYSTSLRWAAIGPESCDIAELPARAFRYQDSDLGDGVIFISSEGWSQERQETLVAQLRRTPAPVLVANPALVAPREGALTVEPGSYAHDVWDRTDVRPEFFGKPYANAFAFLIRQSGGVVRPGNTLMIGDTLHTDILGGAAAGFDTMLVTDHGVLSQMDAERCIQETGISPTFIAPEI